MQIRALCKVTHATTTVNMVTGRNFRIGTGARYR